MIQIIWKTGKIRIIQKIRIIRKKTENTDIADDTENHNFPYFPYFGWGDDHGRKVACHVDWARFK